MKKIVAISGSLRKDSYNTLLLKEIEKIIKEKVEFELLDISTIPFFNEDIENDNYPEIDYLKKKISEANLIIIATPEYNYSISGVLKNALDWFSRSGTVFVNKDIAIISASLSRFGGVRAQNHLRQILLGMNANVLNKELFISSASELFKDNKLIDEKTVERLEEFSETIIETIK